MGSPTLLRSLLAEYTDRFDELSSARIRLQSQRALARRFLAHHARASMAEIERVLLRQQAIGEPSHERDAMLRDLRSFQASLRPPLTTFARTLILLVVLLVAQLLGRLPLIPIVTGPERKPALGSLSEAVDIDPGHVAKAVGDLLGSPVSTILGAVATLSAAAFLMLWPAIPAYRRMRRLVGAPCTQGSIAALEQELFAQHPGGPPQRRPFDLLVLWSLAIFAVALGLAWYKAYSEGLMRQTLSPIGRRGLIAALGTSHPTMLGAGGLALVAGGIVVSMFLIVRHPGSVLRRWGWIERSRATRVAVAVATPVVLASMLGFSGLVAFALPGVKSYRDPMLAMRMTGSAAPLIERPVIGMNMRCRPTPCGIHSARIDGADDPLDPLADAIDVRMGKTITSLSELPTKPVTPHTWRTFRRLVRVLRLGGRRITVPHSELVEVRGARSVPRWLADAEPARVFEGGSPLQSMVGALAIPSDVRQFALVLADHDLARLLSGLQRDGRRARLELEVRIGKLAAPPVRLPLIAT
jgi:hypothetical protein